LALCVHNAWAQEPVHRVGFLASTEVPELQNAFIDGLRERGYVVGRNLQLDFRYTQGEAERIPALINELVSLHPEIIVASGPPNAIAVRNAAPATPVVFIGISDPVAIGLVQSLAHPGGNVTGSALAVPEQFVAKQLQLLKTVVPTARRIAVLANPTNPMHQRDLAKFPDTARRLAIELLPVEASNPEQIEEAFETAHAKGVDAIHVFGDPLVSRESQKVVDLANKYRLPSSYLFRAAVVQGGLMSYGPNPIEYWRGGAVYVDKILKGAKPGELPVAQPIRFDLTINLKTATALGLTIPPDVLAQATELIE
jgi:putative ABC transport system substrate-binding protein